MRRIPATWTLTGTLKPTHALLALAALVLFAFGIAWIFRYPLVTDDPFITYRYARNLLEGQGFVYNPGEHVLSTTTPLYSLLLAALGSFWRDIPSLGFWLSVLSFAICAWLVYLLAAYFEMRAAGALAALLTLVSPGLVLTFGLETGFYLALAFGASYSYLRQRDTLAFALLALLTLTRNDGILLATILGLHLLWRQLVHQHDKGADLSLYSAPRILGDSARATPQFHFGALLAYQNSPPASRRLLEAVRLIRRPFLVYLFIFAPWLVFAWWWFGSPFPLTLTAKIAQAQSGLWDPFAVGFLKWLRVWSVSILPIILFALVGFVRCVQTQSRLLLLALWALVHLTAYSILGVAFYPWYVAPLSPVAALFAGIGVEYIGRVIAGRVSSPVVFPGVVTLAALSLLALQVRADLDAGMREPSPKVQVYRQAAEWLAQSTPRETTVDALEVGVIGYYDERRTYDFVGLVDSGQIPYLRTLELAAGVRRRSADYVIMIPPDVWLPQDSWFAATYHRVLQIRAPGFYAGKPLVIYQRVDSGRSIVESRALNLSFEKRVDLLGVDLFSRTVPPGDTLPVELHLREIESPGKDTKFTLQLVGAQNHVVAQSDTYYPARLPENNQPFVDHQGLPVARDAPPGSYDLILAMYDARSGDRVNLFDSGGSNVGDFIALGKIQVQ